MKIVLVRPPYIDLRFGPPIGLTYISKSLKENGHDVYLYDINLDVSRNVNVPLDRYNRDFVLAENHPAIPYAEGNIETYCDEVLAHKPDIVGFYLSYPTVGFGNEMARRISGKVKCIAGGPQTTYHPETFLEGGLYQAVVVGYGEEAVLDAINGRGIFQKDLLKNKEYLPDYSDISINDYKGMLPVITTRGCPNNCNFCTQNYPYYYHSVESVVRQVKEAGNIRKLMYNDSNINVNAGRTEQLFKELALSDTKPFGHIFGMQINKGYERYIPWMAEAGVREARLGIESGSPGERRSMNKVKFDNQTAVDFIKHLTDNEITAIVQFIFCFPSQTDDDREKTLAFIEKINDTCDPEYVKHVFNKFVVHYGTEDYFTQKFNVKAVTPQTWENERYNPGKIKEIYDEFLPRIPGNCTIYL